MRKTKMGKRKTQADIKCYAIKWFSKITGFKSHGTTLFTQSTIVKLTNKLNRNWPELDHNTMDSLELKMGILEGE
jgi:hypothetical protein